MILLWPNREVVQSRFNYQVDIPQVSITPAPTGSPSPTGTAYGSIANSLIFSLQYNPYSGDFENKGSFFSNGLRASEQVVGDKSVYAIGWFPSFDFQFPVTNTLFLRSHVLFQPAGVSPIYLIRLVLPNYSIPIYRIERSLCIQESGFCCDIVEFEWTHLTVRYDGSTVSVYKDDYSCANSTAGTKASAVIFGDDSKDSADLHYGLSIYTLLP